MKLYHTPGSLAKQLGVTLDRIADMVRLEVLKPIAFAGSAERMMPLFDGDAAQAYREQHTSKATEAQVAQVPPTAEVARSIEPEAQEAEPAAPMAPSNPIASPARQVTQAATYPDRTMAAALNRKPACACDARPGESHLAFCELTGRMPDAQSGGDRDSSTYSGDKCAVPSCRYSTRSRNNVFCGPCWRHLTPDEQDGLRNITQDNVHQAFNAEAMAEAVETIKTRRGWR